MRRLFPVAASTAAGALLLGIVVWAAAGGRFAVGDDATATDAETAATEDAAAPATPAAKEPPAAKAAGPEAAPENPFPNRSPAPGLEGGADWLNVGGPIGLKDLRGKVVILDFWTFCCINCMHVLPDLEHLEQKYPNELVVIGVHSAKFDNEKDSATIRDAILRYEIAHPVINDAEMTVWRKFGARSWPTLVLIDPEGNYCGYVSGEGNREVLDEAVGRLIAYHAAKGTLDRTPVRFDLERYEAEKTPLRFPGKVLADAERGRLFVSDTGHNRIVVTDLDGKLIDVIGRGAIGKADGPYATAEFDHPQGMALDGDTLYVADTENHLIRAIDLKKKTVATLVGTGEQARFREVGGTLRAAALNSPWDLLIHGRTLYVAMAGPHQLWTHELGSNRIGVFAGSGREDIVDGRRLEAAFAQPSGLATDGEALYVADSEGSAIRRVPFEATKPVTTVAGASDLPNGRSLFEFGDKDGKGGNARLQHPLGVAYRDGLLYVADSYNHKLKTIRLDVKGVGTVTTLLGTGKAGDGLDPVQFSEPAGLAATDDALFVADTNNHRLLRIDPAMKAAAVVTIAGLLPPQAEDVTPAAPAVAEEDAPEAEAQTVVGAETARVSVALTLPEGYKLNPQFPLAATVVSQEGDEIVAPATVGKRVTATIEGGNVAFALPLAASAGTATLKLSLSYGYCREGKGGLCKVGRAVWSLPLTVASAGADSVSLSASAE